MELAKKKFKPKITKNKNPSNQKKIEAALSAEDYKFLNDAIKSKDPQIVTKSDSILKINTSKKPAFLARYDNPYLYDDLGPTDDETTYGGGNVYDPTPGDYYQYDHYTYDIKTLAGNFTVWRPFTKRNIAISVTVPYIYRYGKMVMETKVEANPNYPQPIVWLDGTNVGDIDNKFGSVAIYKVADLRWNGSADGSFSENRTAIYTTNGKVLLKSQISAAVIQVGSEVEAGLVVQSKENTVSTFTYSVSFTMLLQTHTPQYPGADYKPNVIYSMSAYNYGIQKN